MRWRSIADAVVLLVAASLQASVLVRVTALLLAPPAPTASVAFVLEPPAGVPGEAAAVFLIETPVLPASAQ